MDTEQERLAGQSRGKDQEEEPLKDSSGEYGLAVEEEDGELGGDGTVETNSPANGWNLEGSHAGEERYCQGRRAH